MDAASCRRPAELARGGGGAGPADSVGAAIWGGHTARAPPGGGQGWLPALPAASPASAAAPGPAWGGALPGPGARAPGPPPHPPTWHRRQPVAGAAGNAGQRLTTNDALSYLREVKTRFMERKEVYDT